jgi:ParB-like nuclease domain
MVFRDVATGSSLCRSRPVHKWPPQQQLLRPPHSESGQAHRLPRKKAEFASAPPIQVSNNGLHSPDSSGTEVRFGVSETRNIPIASLLIWEHNPRLSSVDAGQRVSLEDIVRDDPQKLLALARSIADHGLNPAELLIVKPDSKRQDLYVVLEGNRRLCALKILENPAILRSAVSDAVRRQFVAASKTYGENGPIDSVLCTIIVDEAEYRYWLHVRHMGEQRGVGVSRWGTLEQSRFADDAEPYRELLERLMSEDRILATDIRKNVTNFQRVVETKGVRDYLGFSFDKGRVHFQTPWPNVAKTLVRLVNDLKAGIINVNNLRTTADRIAYIRTIGPGSKPSSPVSKGRKSAHKPPIPSSAPSTGSAPIPVALSRAATNARPTLIPGACTLKIGESRIKGIETELRTLPIERYPNAAAIILRVFLELSVDQYIVTNTVAIHPKAKLFQKVSAVISDLETAGHLTKAQARAVRAAVQAGTHLATSITTMHDFVHNNHMTPSPSDLRSSWDRLEPLFAAIWP